MRPIQSLLLLFTLLVCGLAAFFLLRTGDAPRGVAPSIEVGRLDPPEAEDEPRASADLVAPTGDKSDPSSDGRSALTDPDAAEIGGTGSEVHLAVERLVRGRVVDERGEPIEGAEVFVAEGIGGDLGLFSIDLAAPPGEAGGGLDWLRRKSATTGAEGRFRIEAPRGAEAQLAVRASGFSPHDDRVALREDGSTDLGDLELEQGVVLAGRVLDAGGRGVEGVVLRAQSTDGMEEGITLFSGERGRYLTRSGSGGNFRVDQLEPGPFRIRFTHDEYPTATLDGVAPRAGVHRTDLVVELTDGVAIEGRVAGLPENAPDGLLVAAAPSLEDLGAERMKTPPARRSAPLRPDGTFRIPGLVEGVDYRVDLRDGDEAWFGERKSGSVVAAAGERDVVLKWRLDAAVRLRAVDAETGEPVEEFEISAGIDWTQPLTRPDGRPWTSHPGGEVRYSGLHPREGANEVLVRIEAVGYEPWERRGIELAEGEQLDLGDVALLPVPLLVVTVRDALTKAPIRRARVTVSNFDPDASRPGDGEDFEIGVSAISFSSEAGPSDVDEIEFDPFSMGGSETERTDEEGRATFSSRPGETVKVRVKHDAYAGVLSEPIQFGTGSGNVEWTADLTRGGTVVVSAFDETGQILVGRKLEHRAPDEEDRGVMFGGGPSRKTDEQGRARYEHLAPGVHRFRVGSSGGGAAVLFGGGAAMMSYSSTSSASRGEDPQRAWSEILVTEGGEHEVRVVGPARGSAYGKITEEGVSLAGATVRLVRKGTGESEMMNDPFFGHGGSSARTDGDGDWTLDELEEGEYELRVTHPTRVQPAVFDFTLAKGENDLGTVDLAVSVLEGRVVNEQGEPVVGARVTPNLFSESGEASTVRMSRSITIADGDGVEIVDASVGGAGAGPTLTDEDGRYRLRGVAADRSLQVDVDADGYRPAQSKRVKVLPGETETGIDFVLLRGGSVRATVTQADGTPVQFALLIARFDGNEAGIEPRTEMVGQKGVTVLEGLAPGTWVLTAQSLGLGRDGGSSGDEESSVERTVEVRGGETTEVGLELP